MRPPSPSELREAALDRAAARAAWADRRAGLPRLRAMFKGHLGYDLNLEAPQTYNEKIQWRKLFDLDPVYVAITDKLRLHGYLARKLGKARAQALMPRVLGVTARPTAGWMRGFGTGVVFKANHGCGWNQVVRPGDTPDYPAMAAQGRRWLARRYGRPMQEWAYWQITPRMFAEELILGQDGRSADDLKFLVIGGQVQAVSLVHDRFGTLRFRYLDRDWNTLPLHRPGEELAGDYPPPPAFVRMRTLAERLGRDFDCIWVDFLFTETRFALNELTLYRHSGFRPLAPAEYDLRFGQIWQQRARTGAVDLNRSRDMIFTVAIDGPAAAGKGTISRAVAQHFGFAHLDTGLLYRAVGAQGGDPVAAAQALTPADLDRPDLRSLEAGQAASRVAAIPQVRAALTEFQRRFARRDGGAVLDGRDIGTVICPEAEVKLYVTASAEVRANRRWREVGGDPAHVLAEVEARDARDMGRADAPLCAAPDARVIDTTALDIDAAVAHAIAAIEARLADPA